MEAFLPALLYACASPQQPPKGQGVRPPGSYTPLDGLGGLSVTPTDAATLYVTGFQAALAPALMSHYATPQPAWQVDSAKEEAATLIPWGLADPSQDRHHSLYGAEDAQPPGCH
jgi:hypothetical protein